MLGSSGINTSKSTILSSANPTLYQKVPRNGSRCGFWMSTSSNISFYLRLIFYRCDEITLDGSKKTSNMQSSSYSHAMKMRAAMTYGFGRVRSCGNTPWRLNDCGQWRGNPSISLSVSRYMISLRRRKVIVS
jgi:hypothetical protein